MVRSIEGVYRGGKVELLEPAPVNEASRVIITFLSEYGQVDLAARGISPDQAADLRIRLKSFESDWNRPELDGYDKL